MYVVEHLEDYEKKYPVLQPDILTGESPKDIADLLRKKQSSRSSREQQLINAWNHWRDSVCETEGKNETSLRMLFRALVIFNREIEATKDETTKNKYSECIGLITAFLFDIWNIREAMFFVLSNGYLPLTKQMNHVSGMSSEWRDPIGHSREE